MLNAHFGCEGALQLNGILDYSNDKFCTIQMKPGSPDLLEYADQQITVVCDLVNYFRSLCLTWGVALLSTSQGVHGMLYEAVKFGIRAEWLLPTV